jgi:hypothetical protein
VVACQEGGRARGCGWESIARRPCLLMKAAFAPVGFYRWQPARRWGASTVGIDARPLLPDRPPRPLADPAETRNAD